MNFATLVVTTCLWQALHVLCTRAAHVILSHPRLGTFFPKQSHAALRVQLPSYLVSTLHALLVTFRGVQHLHRLLPAPTYLKLRLQPLTASYVAETLETHRVLRTNALLAGYLLQDLVHVLWRYPQLGGLDTIAHHAVFLGCAVLAGLYGMYPFMFAWLILGEASTTLLNARWGLIKAGRGDTRLFNVVEKSFAMVFFLTRGVMYTVGLAHQLSIAGQAPLEVPRYARVAPLVCVVSGFVLNLMWMGKIYGLATGSRRRRRPHAE